MPRKRGGKKKKGRAGAGRAFAFTTPGTFQMTTPGRKRKKKRKAAKRTTKKTRGKKTAKKATKKRRRPHR